jgi:glycosyltransferase involved in cell wall biosynthesis
MKKIFILIPSFSSSGPIKGAIALANSLSDYRSVTIVSIKKGNGSDAFINERIRCICLAKNTNTMFNYFRIFKNILIDAGGKNNTATISFCFSADILNSFCSRYTNICSSVRGNLFQNYKLDYGLFGFLAAAFHMILLNKFNKVVAMSIPMANQIFFFTKKYPDIIGNFIDEKSLFLFKKIISKKNDNEIRFVFVGNLTVRKKPLLLLHSIKQLIDQGHNVSLDLIGDGPLFSKVYNEICKLKIHTFVRLHGHLSNPYEIVSSADIFVLPSLSEGTSRASLEALFIGLPCILRDIDGNSELIKNNFNGILFKNDSDLTESMKLAINILNKEPKISNLLPPFFHQNESSLKYLSLVEND